jgi:DNA invertase Pin-like site-specific DNA recombinase
MNRIIGYARVSTREQNLDLQLDALKKEGCVLIVDEKTSSMKERPKLEGLLSALSEGDVLVVWKLDRLARSLKELVLLIDSLDKKGVAFRSIMDGIDTKSALGRCQFGIFSALAEYERAIIVERTKAGLEAARLRGKVGGRKKGLSKNAIALAKSAKTLYESGVYSSDEICSTLKIGSKTTLYKYLESQGTAMKRKKII